MATAKKAKRKRKSRVDPLVIPPGDAAVRASVSPEEIYRAVARGVFTVIAPHGRGVGKNYWLYMDEVDLWATGRDDAVLAFRKEKGRLKKAAAQ